MPFHDVDENTGTYMELSTMLMITKEKAFVRGRGSNPSPDLVPRPLSPPGEGENNERDLMSEPRPPRKCQFASQNEAAGGQNGSRENLEVTADDLSYHDVIQSKGT